MEGEMTSDDAIDEMARALDVADERCRWIQGFVYGPTYVVRDLLRPLNDQVIHSESAAAVEDDSPVKRMRDRMRAQLALEASAGHISAFRAEIESINLRHNARVSELLAANNAEVEKRRDAERWAAFGRAVMKQHKDGDCGDVDGGSLQDLGVQTGVLQVVEAKGPCAEEGCMCAATCGDWPVDCYRVVTP